MRVTLLVLENGTSVISYTDELEMEPRVHLWCPHTVSGTKAYTLKSWPQYAVDKHVLLHSGRLLTACEPEEDLVKAYIKRVGQPPKGPKQPVMLTEEESVPDDYEPRYVEE